MKRLLMPILLCTIGLLLSGCQLQDSYSGKVIFSGAHVLRAGETIDGELLVLGGSIQLEENSRVRGSLHLLEGSVDLAGTVEKDMNVLLGQAVLQAPAVVGGSLTISGGEVDQMQGARVEGGVHRAASPPENGGPSGQAGRLVTFLLQAPLLAGLAFLVVRFLPGFVENIGQAGTRYFLASFSVGILGWVVGLSLLLIMAYTILLLPLTVLGFLAMLAATSYGAIPYALWIGQQLILRLGWRLPAAVCAALGMVILVSIVELLRFVPVIGGLLPLVMLTAAFGAALLTRFGFYRFEPPNPEVAG
jgi:hypothetical protein